MKSYFATILAAGASARVHNFFAETNLICEMCQDAVRYEANNEDEQLDKLYELFPKLQERIQTFADNITEIVNLQDPQGTCQRLNLCESYNMIEMIEENQTIDLQSIAEHVNSNATNWIADPNTRFDDMTIADIKKIMGTVVDPDWVVKTGEVKEWSGLEAAASFDANLVWPECEGIINNIRDQANCGSCWAFGTTEALNDRICISSSGKMTTYLSTADTAGCCNAKECFSFGCNGGQVGTPWGWFTRTGVVTGGGYGDDQECYAYTMPMCNHHSVSSSLPACDTITQVDPQCYSSSRLCPSNNKEIYSEQKYQAFSSYGFPSSNTIEAIKEDITKYGSVTAAFTVYEDFLTYASGVYRHTTGAELGGHAIKVIGWGTENAEPYWLCNNSWNSEWGAQGTFKILMGDCGIDGQMHAGLVPTL